MVKSLMVNWTQWTIGTGSVGGFGGNGDAAENVRELGNDPWGREIILWKAVPDAVSGADGGWSYNPSDAMAISHKRMYRSSVWIKRTGGTNGTFYLGTYGYNSGGTNVGVIRRSDGSNQTNPYFYWGDPTQDTWELIVGHIWPSDATGTSHHADSGRYTIAGGKIANITYDYQWRSDNVRGNHRTYLYYCTDINVRQYWCYPRFEMCDGAEPTITELLAGYDSDNYDLYLSHNMRMNKQINIG